MNIKDRGGISTIETVLGGPFGAPPASDQIEPLIGMLWDRILERGPAARAASLLDLKVGVLRVHRLFAAITETTGVDLPITVMFQAPTITALADIIRRRETPPAQPAILVQPSDGPTPLFLFPGVGGVALELFELGRLVRLRGPVYVNLFRGLDGKEPPQRSVAEMARYQSAVIRSVQPHGPYCVAGFSLGGLVALETARVLTEAGETVVFVGLLEPNLPERLWPASVKRAFLLKRLNTHLQALKVLSPGQICGYLAERAKPLFARLHRLLGGAANAGASPYTLKGLPEALAASRDAGLAAFYGYEIKPYAGNVVFFDSVGGDPLSCRPLDVFPKYFASYESFVCGGDHSTLLRQPHVTELAAQMSSVLEKLDAS